MSRLRSWLAGLVLRLLLVGAVFGILLAVQYLWHPFDSVIAFVNQDIVAMGSSFSQELVAGISIGTLVLVVVMVVVPLLMKGVDNKAYWISISRGILASGVFLVSELVYKEVERYGRFWFFFAVIAMIVLTFMLVELLARTTNREKEKSVRTDLLANVVSGLAFSLILRLGTYALQSLGILA